MARKNSSRKFQITINNPLDKGYTHEQIRSVIDEFSVVYACFCDEIGLESGTPHTHIFLVTKSGVMFDTIKRRFYGAHIETAYGSYTDNYNYIRKIGDKYKDKKESNLAEKFEEIGTLPKDKNSNSTLSEEICEMIESGCSVNEIIKEYPSALNHITNIEKYISLYNMDEVKKKFRSLSVYYIWGATGSGKTRYVMEKYGYDNVYRVTNYSHPFDSYNKQDVILFDEFRSSLPIADMLVYLDGYPVNLPCRYADKPAFYTKVYIVSNIPIKEQYTNIQQYEPETYKAFLRRFTESEIELFG